MTKTITRFKLLIKDLNCNLFKGLSYHAMTGKVVRKMDLDVWQQNIVPRSWCRNLDMSSAITNCAKDYISHMQKFWRTGRTDLVDCLRQMWKGIPCSSKSWRICRDEFEWVHMKTRRICCSRGMRAVSTMIVSAAETALAVATSPVQSSHFHMIQRSQVTTKLDSICTHLQLQFLRKREGESILRHLRL